MSDLAGKMTAADFLSVTLAYLPYETAEEPLNVIYRINRAVPVRQDIKFLSFMNNINSN